MNPFVASAVGSLAVGLTLILARRTVFSWTLIGTFCLASLITVVAGVLAYPWVAALAASSFQSFDLDVLSDTAMVRAIVLQVGGLILVLVSYGAMRLVLSRGVIAPPPPLLSAAHFQRAGGSRLRLQVIFAVCLLASGAYVALNADLFLRGVVEGMLARQPSVLLAARRAAVGNYGFVVLIYNILPFLTALVWLRSRSSSSPFVRMMGLAAVAWTSLMLLLVFQKRPLLVFLITLFVLWYWESGARLGGGGMAAAKRAVMGMAGAGALALVLLSLYETSTQISQQSDSTVEAVTDLSAAATARVFGRLSLPSIMYAEYFPEMAPHYGLDNVGMLSSLRNEETVLDSRLVFRRFSLTDAEGSVAISAIGDFYGGFGWHGWAIGVVLLGAALALGERLLKALPPSRLSAVFTVYCMVTAFYFSQASVPRSLMGYGFAFFLLCWLLLRRWGGRRGARALSWPVPLDAPGRLEGRAQTVAEGP